MEFKGRGDVHCNKSISAIRVPGAALIDTAAKLGLYEASP